MAEISREYPDASIVTALGSHLSLQLGAPQVLNATVQFGENGTASVEASLIWTVTAADAQAVLDAAGAAS